MARRPTLQDVARRAGVSRSSASYVYTQPGRVSTELRARVLAAAAELRYAGPDPLAASLRRGRAGALGVLFTEALSFAFADPGAVLFLQGVATAGERADVALTLLPVPPSFDPTLAAIRNSVVDGVIVYSLPDEHPALQVIAERRLPTVLVDMPPAPGSATLVIDDEGGAHAVAAHVLARGRRHVGLLADRLAADDVKGFADPRRRERITFPVSRWRLAGYDRALREQHIAGAPLYEAAGNTVADGRAGARALLALDPRPTAILAMTDQLAQRGPARRRRARARRPGRPGRRRLRRPARGGAHRSAPDHRPPGPRGQGRDGGAAAARGRRAAGAGRAADPARGARLHLIDDDLDAPGPGREQAGDRLRVLLGRVLVDPERVHRPPGRRSSRRRP